MRRLLIFVIALMLMLVPAAAAQAHPVGTTGVLVHESGNRVGLTLQLQLDQLNKGAGLDLVPGGTVPQKAVKDLVDHNVRLAAAGQALPTTITGTAFGTVNGRDALVVQLAADAPADARAFTLNYTLLTSSLPGHKVYVSRVVDGQEAELLGVLSSEQPSMDIGKAAPKAGVSDMVVQGMHHIADGYDHLLFLAVLLLSAPLVATRTAAGWRWSPRANSLRTSARRILTVVTAFTVGHSITLLVVSLAWFTPPVQIVETIVALSIAVAALNLVRPMFTNGEVLLAGIFGLVHGMAFATTILEMKLGTADTLLAVLGFNIGIEAAQLIGIALTVPLIHLAATGNFYRPFLTAAAIFAMAASAAWVVALWTGTDSVFTPVFDAVAAHPLFSWIVFAGAMLLLAYAGPKPEAAPAAPARKSPGRKRVNVTAE